jgi:3'(2'), 5'-bisphosphate nucleotidase
VVRATVGRERPRNKPGGKPAPVTTPATIAQGFNADEIARSLFDASIAGARALTGMWKAAIRTDRKADGSLVSQADHAADAAVRNALADAPALAHLPLVSEESAAFTDPGDVFLLLDPLDGTAEFLDQGVEFCVCLALIAAGRPVAGAIVAPALGRGWYAGDVAFAVPLRRDAAVLGPAQAVLPGAMPLPQRPTALVSRRHGDARSAEALKISGFGRLLLASSALKFGLLAEAQAHVHVRCGPTMSWDIAAGDAILSAAGGLVSDLDGNPLRYDGFRSGYRNPPFVAVARPDFLAPLLDAVQRAS